MSEINVRTIFTYRYVARQLNRSSGTDKRWYVSYLYVFESISIAFNALAQTAVLNHSQVT